MVLKKDKNGEYQEEGNVLEGGETIEYANFYDLDKDNHLEIILLIKKQDKTNMYIYKFEDNDTVGIIICKQDNEYVIKYCSDDRIIAREYELV